MITILIVLTIGVLMFCKYKQRFFISASVLFYAAISFLPVQSAPVFSPSKDDTIRIVKNLDSFWERNGTPEVRKGVEVRNLGSFALDGISVGYRMDRIEQALDALRANIFLSDKKSNRYGNIFWYHGDAALPDTNGVEFCTQRDVLVWILYKDKLSDKAKNTLTEILSFSAEGITRHGVKISYTNIILMKTWNLIALGDYTGRPDLSAQGEKLLDEWISYTYNNGIYEYISPTYYAVGMENLSLLYHFAKSEKVRKKAKAGLDYFWTDISLNWYAPSFRLGGTHSRDYDRLTGHADVDNYVRRAGWTNDGAVIERNRIFSLYSFVPPPDSAIQYRKKPFPRFVTQRWGEGEYNYAANYIGTNFSIASSGANYYNMDKSPLVISLGGGEETPVINYFMDGRSDYFGKNKILESSGHMKSLHLRPFIASVQNANEVLFLSAVDDREYIVTQCESIITFPADGEYFIDNQAVSGMGGKLWTAEPPPDGKLTRIENVENDSGEIRITDTDSFAGVGIQGKFPVQPGRRYELRAESYGDGYFLYLNFYGKNKDLVGKENIVPVAGKLNASWSSISVAAPAEAVTVTAWIYSARSAKSLFYVRKAEVCEFIGNKKILLSADMLLAEKKRAVTFKPGSTVFVRRGDSAAAVRIFYAEDSTGKAVDSIILENDGLAFGALSCKVNHSAQKGDGKGWAAVYAVARENIKTQVDYFAFREKVLKVKTEYISDNSNTVIKSEGMAAKLYVSADLSRKKILKILGASAETGKKTLSVNGDDIGKRLLEQVK
jgi:hypothetical protein